MRNLFEHIYSHQNRSKYILPLVAILLLALAGWSISRIHFSENISRMLPDRPDIHQIQEMSQKMSFMDKLVFMVVPDTSKLENQKGIIEFSDSLVNSFQELRPSYISEITYKFNDQAVSSLYDFYYSNLPLFLDSSDYKEMSGYLEKETVEKKMAGNYRSLISPASFAIKDYILKDPLSLTPLVLKKFNNLRLEENYRIRQQRIFTKGGDSLIFFVSTSHPSSETGKNAILIKAIEQRIEQVSRKFNHQFNVYYYGSAAVATGNANRIKKDILLTVGIAVSILLVFLGIFFRRKGIAFILFLPAIFGGGLALGIISLLQGTLSAISLAMGSVLLGITVDYALHLLSHYRHTNSMPQTLRDISLPVLVSVTTTASAFLCLLFVSAEALHDLGLFAAISVVVAALFTLTILPRILAHTKSPKNTSKNSFIDHFTHLQLDKNPYLLGLIIAFTIVAFFSRHQAKFEGDMEKMNYVSPQLKKSEKIISGVSSQTSKSIFLIVSDSSLNEALGYFESIQPKIEDLQESGVIKTVSSPTGLLLSKEKQKKRIAHWKRFWDKQTKEEFWENMEEATSPYPFRTDAFNAFRQLIEKDFKILPPSDSNLTQLPYVNQFINKQDGVYTITSILKVDEENKALVYDKFQNNEILTIFDNKTLTEALISALKEDFNKLVGISLWVVFLLLLLSFGRIELAILTFIPMSVSWIWTLSIMGLLGIKFTIFNIIISTFIFGLGIDYSIFIMQGLLQEYKYGKRNLPSYKTSILLSAFTTIAGIGVLIFAQHPALKSMAVLSIIGILSVILVSYTLEPALFRWFIMNRKYRKKEAYSIWGLIRSILTFTIFILGSLLITIAAFITFYIFFLRKSKRARLFIHYLICCLTRFLVHIMIKIKIIEDEPDKNRFKTPSIIVSNHQSVSDLMLLLMLHPKIIILTKDWVQKNPVFGALVKLVDFYPVSMGHQDLLEKLKPKIEEGYSIVVFPEGTRAKNHKIKRFHKGAFYLAEHLKLDIQPVILHGSGHILSKGDDLMLKKAPVRLRFLPKIHPENQEYGKTYSEKAKGIGRYFRAEFQRMIDQYETPGFYKYKLIQNFLYKGPVVEWYMRIKLWLEKNYRNYHELLPKKGRIYDIGCGYGFMSYLMAYAGRNRQITGIDYDEEKIKVAQNGNMVPDNLKFIYADINNYNFEPADAIVMNDLLHYLDPLSQKKLLKETANALKENGLLIIRDGDKQDSKHKGTERTELWSTRILAFNKTNNASGKLNFVGEDDIRTFAKENQLNFEKREPSKFTSNVIFVLKKSANE